MGLRPEGISLLQPNHIDLWAEYFKEREGFETISTEVAIANYKITGDTCYIKDIFVHKDFRKSGEGSVVADKIAVIAKENGCKYLTGSIVPSLPGSTGTMFAMIKYGFKLKESHNDFIILFKEL